MHAAPVGGTGGVGKAACSYGEFDKAATAASRALVSPRCVSCGAVLPRDGKGIRCAAAARLVARWLSTLRLVR